jgi:hypothetical protein
MVESLHCDMCGVRVAFGEGDFNCVKITCLECAAARGIDTKEDNLARWEAMKKQSHANG